jgi:hypothetical protein
MGERGSMALAILKANIEHLKALLDAEADPRKRTPLERQLAEQELKLAALLKARSERQGE